jgi:hypothetical protein
MILEDTARYLNSRSGPLSYVSETHARLLVHFQKSCHLIPAMKRPNTQNELGNAVPCRVRSILPTLSYRSVMTSAPRLGDDIAHLLDLPLRTAEGAELVLVSMCEC